MKAVGLDTCVVVRLLTGEPEQQAIAAVQFLENSYYSGIQVHVSDIVVGEVYYALIYHYDVPQKKAILSLKSLLQSPMIVSTGHALTVLEEYDGKGAGLMDRLIRMDYLNSAHQVITFDKDMARLSNVKAI